MKRPTKTAIANKRKSLLLAVLLTVSILISIIFISLWIKERKKNQNPKPSPTQQQTQTTTEVEIVTVDEEALKKDFWGELYEKADRKILGRANYVNNASLDTFISHTASISDGTKSKAEKFLDLTKSLKTTLDVANTDTNPDPIQPLDFYVQLLYTAESLFTQLEGYIDSIKDQTTGAGSDTDPKVTTPYKFKENEFETMILVVIQVCITDFLKGKAFVFNNLNSKGQLGSVDLDEKELSIYTAIGNYYIIETRDITNLPYTLELIIEKDGTAGVTNKKKAQFENILLYLSLNIHFLLFWEIRIGTNGELSVFQEMLAPKFSKDSTKQEIGALFKQIKGNLNKFNSERNSFMANTKKLLDLVVDNLTPK
eukprot:GAHX01000681.1.p1 GENE.GAHX01000681.1~~GAHX01000681.1.p1  ORF type:complete len:369 (-),score=81.33 GAHX01000681.1:39-1145(-)